METCNVNYFLKDYYNAFHGELPREIQKQIDSLCQLAFKDQSSRAATIGEVIHQLWFAKDLEFPTIANEIFSFATRQSRTGDPMDLISDTVINYLENVSPRKNSYGSNPVKNDSM